MENAPTLLDIFTPRNLTEAIEWAKMIADSDLVPKDYKQKPGNIVIAMAKGAELGLQPMQALEGIAVINGRPVVWGDTAVALVRRHPEFVDMDEGWDDATQTAWCVITRRNQTPQRRTFSLAEAAAAGLANKNGTPWSQGYSKRMCGWRAKSWAMRDVFADATRGLGIREEVAPPEEREIEGEVVRQEQPRLAAVGGGEPAPAGRSKADRVFAKIAESSEPTNRFADATEKTEKGGVILSPKRDKAEGDNGVTVTVVDARPQMTREQVLNKIAQAKSLDDINVALDWVRGASDELKTEAHKAAGEKVAALKNGKPKA